MNKKKWILICAAFIVVAIGMNVLAQVTKPDTTEFTEEFTVEESGQIIHPLCSIDVQCIMCV